MTGNNFKTLMTLDRGGYLNATNGSNTITAVTSQCQSFTGLSGAIIIAGVSYTISSVTNSTTIVLTGNYAAATGIKAWTHAGTANIITVTSTSGWANGDQLAFASTSLTPTECESAIVQSVDSTTQVTLTTSLANSHQGVSPIQAEVINLTRNVKIRGISSSLNGYINIATTAIVILRYTQIYNLGSATANKRGIDVATTTGTFDCQYCSFHDFTNATSTVGARGINITSTSGSNIIIAHDSFYNMNEAAVGNVATTGIQVLNDLVAILTVNTGNTGISIFNFLDIGGSYSNLIAVGHQSTTFAAGGVGFNEASNNIVGGICSNITAHSCTRAGIQITAFPGGTLNNLTVYRNGGVAGINLISTSLTINGLLCFGNAAGLVFDSASSYNVILNAIFASDTVFGQGRGIQFGSSGTTISSGHNFVVENSTFGFISGVCTSHTVSDAYFTSSNGGFFSTFRNCLFSSPTEVAYIGQNFANINQLYSQKHDQMAGNHRTFKYEGIISIDTGIYQTTSPSARLTPLITGFRLQSSRFNMPILSGQSGIPSIYVRQSVTGDNLGLYNGQFPRFFAEKNVAIGITGDLLLATATTASSGAWEILSGLITGITDDGVVSTYVDCGGSGYTTGFCNIDNFSGNLVNDTKGLKFWKDGQPFVSTNNISGSVSSGSSTPSEVSYTYFF